MRAAHYRRTPGALGALNGELRREKAKIEN
jgi:hypothetical protein